LLRHLSTTNTEGAEIRDTSSTEEVANLTSKLAAAVSAGVNTEAFAEEEWEVLELNSRKLN
jgi:hypothetical protein